MAKKVDLQERLNMRFLTVAYQWLSVVPQIWNAVQSGCDRQLDCAVYPLH